jgi:hypothetical protein
MCKGYGVFKRFSSTIIFRSGSVNATIARVSKRGGGAAIVLNSSEGTIEVLTFRLIPISKSIVD